MPPGYGVPSTKGLPGIRAFPSLDITVADQDFAITGVTRDVSGNVLGSCVVKLYRTDNDQMVGFTTSDASGNYRIYANTAYTYYAVAYKAGSPDVEGTTVNTLTAVGI